MDLFSALYAKAKIYLFHSIQDGKTVWWSLAIDQYDPRHPMIGSREGPFPSPESAEKAIKSRIEP